MCFVIVKQTRILNLQYQINAQKNSTNRDMHFLIQQLTISDKCTKSVFHIIFWTILEKGRSVVLDEKKDAVNTENDFSVKNSRCVIIKGT